MSKPTQEPIQLVLCDMDGTLLRPDHSISPRTLAAVKALQAAGVYFTLATGRPPRGMREQIKQLGIELPTAAFNGGVLVNPDGSYLQTHPVPYEAVKTTLSLLADHDVEVWVFADDQWLLRDPDGPMVAQEQNALGFAPRVVTDFGDYLQRVDKIVAASRNAPLLVELEHQLQDVFGGEALASRSQAFYLDVTALHANKGEALATLAARLGVPLERTMALGDGGNDPAMFKRAGLSVAMGQADEAIRKQAMYVTASNKDDGVAQALERFVLKP